MAADDPLRPLLESTYANGLVYLNETWWPSIMGGKTFPYAFGGRREKDIRAPAMAAYAMALSSQLDFYPYDAHVRAATNRRRAARLAASLALRHAASRRHGWGRCWQSGLWAYYAGVAAWSTWGELTSSDRDAVRRMLRAEATRAASRSPRFAFSADGTPLTPGDTKAEEDTWAASLLYLASVFPYGRFTSTERSRWKSAASAWASAAYATPSDGLAGYNISNDGTLVNHNIVHPDYMVAATQSYLACLTYAIAGRTTPECVYHNGSVVWSALTQKIWAAPDYAAPGGTIYVRSEDGAPTADLYFPQGNDWGTAGMGRRINMAQEDLFALYKGFGDPVDALDFAVLHLSWVRTQQERHDDRHLYEPGEYDFGETRNETFGVAQMAENLAVYRLFTSGALSPPR